MDLWLLLIWAAIGASPRLERVEVYATEVTCRHERALLVREYRWAMTDCLPAPITEVAWALRPREDRP